MYDFLLTVNYKGNMNLPLHPYLPNVKCVMYYESATVVMSADCKLVNVIRS